MSLKRYSVYIETVPVAKPVLTDSLTFNNGHKYVQIDRDTGLLKSFRIDGKEYIKNGFSLTMFDDNPDPWAMGKDQLKRLGTNPESFCLSTAPSGVFSNMKSVQVIEDGEIYWTRYGRAMEYILGVDRHRPFDSPAARRLVERLSPRYLTHEFITEDRAMHADFLRRQIAALNQ